MQAQTTFHAIADPQACAFCGLPAIVGLDCDWLCERCFGEALKDRRKLAEGILTTLESSMIVTEGPGPTEAELREALDRIREVPIEEVWSPLLCGGDE
jgi:hypothetical protein